MTIQIEIVSVNGELRARSAVLDAGQPVFIDRPRLTAWQSITRAERWISDHAARSTK